MAYTTADLLTSILNRGQFPDTTNAKNVASPANLLQLATEELHIKLVPLIMGLREEFFVAHYDQPVTIGQAAYPIPTRSIGNALRDVHVQIGNVIYPLPTINSERIATTTSALPVGYYFENNNVIMYPTPASTNNSTLRMRYFIRPSRLEQISNCAQITSINTSLNQVTVASIPASWQVGTVLDFVKATVPFVSNAIDQTVVAVSGTTVTFNQLPSDCAVNDWLALAEYSPIPQIPMELMPVLSQLTVVAAIRALGHFEALASATQELAVCIENSKPVLTPRNQGDVKKVTNDTWRKNMRIRWPYR